MLVSNCRRSKKLRPSSDDLSSNKHSAFLSYSNCISGSIFMSFAQMRYVCRWRCSLSRGNHAEISIIMILIWPLLRLLTSIKARLRLGLLFCSMRKTLSSGIPMKHKKLYSFKFRTKWFGSLWAKFAAIISLLSEQGLF